MNCEVEHLTAIFYIRDAGKKLLPVGALPNVYTAECAYADSCFQPVD